MGRSQVSPVHGPARSPSRKVNLLLYARSCCILGLGRDTPLSGSADHPQGLLSTRLKLAYGSPAAAENSVGVQKLGKQKGRQELRMFFCEFPRENSLPIKHSIPISCISTGCLAPFEQAMLAMLHLRHASLMEASRKCGEAGKRRQQVV